jgi:RNA polymerase sigma factor (sigma-70 family)
MPTDFDKLVEEYHGLVMSLIRRYYSGRLRDHAEDLSQEIWIKLYEAHKKNESNIVDFKSYLYRTVQTTLWDAIRSLEKQAGDLPLLETDTPNEETVSRHERMALEKLAGHLEPHESQVVKLYLQGFSNQEMAVLTGSSEGGIRNLLTRVKKKLAKWGNR